MRTGPAILPALSWHRLPADADPTLRRERRHPCRQPLPSLALVILSAVAHAAPGLFVADGRTFAGQAEGAVTLLVETLEGEQFSELVSITIEADIEQAPLPHPRFSGKPGPFFMWSPEPLPEGTLRVTALQGETVIGRAVRVPFREWELWALFVGPVFGEPGHYESYPTAMVEENGAHRMWIGGSWAGDAIFGAVGMSPYEWRYVEGPEMRGPDGIPHHPVIAPTRPRGEPGTPYGYAHGWYTHLDPGKGEDGLHAADPSVVRVPPRTPEERPFYLMYYTGHAGDADPNSNDVFCAISRDVGVTWEKLGIAIPAMKPRKDTYGSGQSSVVLRDHDGDGSLDLVHFFTDTTVGQPCLALGDPYGDPLKFERVTETGALQNLGNYTWDMKWSEELGQYVGVVALNGPPGAILVAASEDGLDWAGEQARVPMEWLVDDKGQLSCNNGGWLGSPEGHLLPDPLSDRPGDAWGVYYYGGGEAMQWDGGGASWDIAAVELWLRATGPEAGE